MDGTGLLWLPGSFYRRPEWRWLRAVYLVERGGRGDRRVDDGWVAHALAVVRGRGGDRPKAAAVRAAHHIWANGAPDRRWELEARLLTEAPLEHVARRCGLPVRVVGAYAAVFFAVRPMRAAVDWVLTRAIGYRPPGVFTSPQPGGVWKYAGFFGGATVLDVVLASTTGRPLPEGLVGDTGSRRRFDEARLRLLARLWVALVCAGSGQQIARVIAAREQLRDLEAGPDPASSKAVGAFWTALPGLKKTGHLGKPRAPDECRVGPGAAGATAAPHDPGNTAEAGRSPRTREGCHG